MNTTLLLQGPGLGTPDAETIARRLGGRLRGCPHGFRIEMPAPPDPGILAALRDKHRCDINSLPREFDPGSVGLVISDMDSTFIGIECIDEIADHAGLKPQVAAITAAAMRGEIDFETSLTRRVGLLAGLPETVLEQVYERRLRLNPGAQELVEGLHARRIPFALVSGGFTFFTTRLQARYGLDFTLANELEIEHGRLTGRVRGKIVGAQAKADFLEQLCARLDISPHRTIAIGDGANDLPMLQHAGLGVAYHAKPALKAVADLCFDHCGLDALLALFDAC